MRAYVMEIVNEEVVFVYETQAEGKSFTTFLFGKLRFMLPIFLVFLRVFKSY